jgi:hypothetical protein
MATARILWTVHLSSLAELYALVYDQGSHEDGRCVLTVCWNNDLL